MKDPKNWPKKMQEDWDGGRDGLRCRVPTNTKPAYRKARECIDEFKPDFVFSFW